MLMTLCWLNSRKVLYFTSKLYAIFMMTQEAPTKSMYLYDVI